MLGEMAKLIEHDKALPLNPLERIIGEDEELFTLHVTFASQDGRRVPGIFVKGKAFGGKLPGVMVQHGAGTSKWAAFVTAAINLLARDGFACLAIDSIGHGEREDGWPQGRPRAFSLPFMVDNVIDLMRALDYLEARDDVDSNRMGYVGSSMGGMLGTILCALDKRIKAVVLRCTGARTRFPEVGQAHEEASSWDPAQFIPFISPSPLLMLNNERDEVFPKAAVESLFTAAREPKQLKWFPGGHRDNREAHAGEAWLFLREHL